MEQHALDPAGQAVLAALVEQDVDQKEQQHDAGHGYDESSGRDAATWDPVCGLVHPARDDVGEDHVQEVRGHLVAAQVDQADRQRDGQKRSRIQVLLPRSIRVQENAQEDEPDREQAARNGKQHHGSAGLVESLTDEGDDANAELLGVVYQVPPVGVETRGDRQNPLHLQSQGSHAHGQRELEHSAHRLRREPPGGDRLDIRRRRVQAAEQGPREVPQCESDDVQENHRDGHRQRRGEHPLVHSAEVENDRGAPDEQEQTQRIGQPADHGPRSSLLPSRPAQPSRTARSTSFRPHGP